MGASEGWAGGMPPVFVVEFHNNEKNRPSGIEPILTHFFERVDLWL
jgi:hypothetical protein